MHVQDLVVHARPDLGRMQPVTLPMLPHSVRPQHCTLQVQTPDLHLPDLKSRTLGYRLHPHGRCIGPYSSSSKGPEVTKTTG